MVGTWNVLVCTDIIKAGQRLARPVGSLTRLPFAESLLQSIRPDILVIVVVLLAVHIRSRRHSAVVMRWCCAVQLMHLETEHIALRLGTNLVAHDEG